MSSRESKKLLLCLAVLFCIISFVFFSDNSVVKAMAASASCGPNLTWKYDEKSYTLTISGSGPMDNYSDSEYENKQVTTAPWRIYYDVIKTIVINDGVTSIGNNAFTCCIRLSSIKIPNTVTNIGKNAFWDCRSLSTISLPNSLTDLNTGVFGRCTALVSIVIPDTVERIGHSAFFSCISLDNIIIPDSVITLGNGAFRECYTLSHLSLPNSIESIGNYSFSHCKGLKKIIIPESVIHIGKGAIEYCKSLITTSLNYTCSYVSESMFLGCESLKTVYISSSINTIHDNAFNECVSLTDVYYGGDEADRHDLSIADNNSNFNNATWHYNSILEANIIKSNSTDNKKTYDYRTTVTFTANVPEGGSVQWYVDGKPAGKDKTLTVIDMTKDYTVKVVVTDKDGNQTMDEEQVTVKNGFFDIIIWFFVHLFNPGAYNVEQ